MKASPKIIKNILWLAGHRKLTMPQLAKALGYQSDLAIKNMVVAVCKNEPCEIDRNLPFIAERLGLQGRDYILAGTLEQVKQFVFEQEDKDPQRELEATAATMRSVSGKGVNWLNWWMFWRWI
jgi:hypothetical protein